MTPREIVESYFASGFRVVFWPTIGDAKGPREEGWPSKPRAIDDYRDGMRVGLVTGSEVASGKFLSDVDIDWAAGSLIAQYLLPPTGFVFGRASKRVSHCFYTTSEPLASQRYEDVDKTCLIELRGTKANGELGLQTMAPPSVWSRGAQREPLAFVKHDAPTHVESSSQLKQRVCLAAIAMLLAKHFGHNGFGHEARLCWAGFLLRAGISVDDLASMGEAISTYCNNREVVDVRRVLESTAAALQSDQKKVKGGPALAKLLGDKGKLVIARVNEWLGRDSDFVRNSDGLIVKDHQDNIARALELLDVKLAYHAFSEQALVQNGAGSHALSDATVDSLWLRIDRECRFRPTFAFFEKVVNHLAHDRAFHSVRDYLDALQWDHTPRLDTWLVDYAGAADTLYVRAVSAIVLLAAVRRIRQPGCKYDEMLVLESGQGLNKSSALRALCPRDEWFSDDLPLNVDAKQIIERTLGKWIIEASDLAGKRKAEVEQLKSMLSRQVDGPARLAYARHPVERARQFILIGTTNSALYLTDMTGARRFWPVTVAGFDVDALIAARDQLWAEAAQREAQGESIRLHESLWPAAEQEQETRRVADAWEHELRSYLLGVEPSADSKRRVSTSDLWTALGIETARRDRVGGARISEIMQRFGFRSTTIRKPHEEPQRGYVTDNERALQLAHSDEHDAQIAVKRSTSSEF